MRRKLMGMLLSAVMVIGMMPVNAKGAQEGNAGVRAVADGEEVDEEVTHQAGEMTDMYSYGMGALPSQMEVSSPILTSQSGSKRAVARSGSYAAKYDPREESAKWITSVKNQGQYGCCWAFASTAAMESSLIKSGLATDDIDLSELNMIYYMYSDNYNDTYDNSANSVKRIYYDRNYVANDDSGNKTTDFTLMANAGGYIDSVAWQTADGAGPYPEVSGEDYNTSAGNSGYTPTAATQCFATNGYRLKAARMCAFDENNIDAVKKLIMEYGGVAANFYCEQTRAGTIDTNSCFKSTEGTHSYYNPNGANYNINHAIEVVGWDDDYSDFKTSPSKNGAWLVKNSWGNADDDGYIWLSYYNIGQKAQAVAYEFERVTAPQNVYQYDGSDIMNGTLSYGSGTGYYLAFFTADSNTDNLPEVISRVGVGTDANASYEISVLIDPEIASGKLTYDEKRGVTSCTTTYAGYYVWDLSEEVAVNSGNTFAICIKADKGTKIYTASGENAYGKGAIGSEEKIENGQYYTGGSLNSLSKPQNGDNEDVSFPIKAFTSEKAYEAVTGISIDKESLSLDWGDSSNNSAILTATLSPADAVPGIIWDSSEPDVASVTPSANGKTATVTAHTDGTCVITASSYDGVFSAACTVTVHNENEDGYIAKTSKSGSLYWSVDNAGKLSVRGSGDYNADYNVGTNASGEIQYVPPWVAYADDITTASVKVNNITSMKYMFYGCNKLVSVSFAGSDTSKVGSMFSIFQECTSLQNVDFTDFSTDNCYDMGGMFYDCNALKNVDVSGFSTSEAMSMQFMFYYCIKLESIDVSGFDTSNVQYMNYMFSQCLALTELDASGLTFSSGVNVANWLEGNTALNTLKVPKAMPSGITLPASDGYQWKDDSGNVCTAVTPSLSKAMIYTRGKSSALDGLYSGGTSGGNGDEGSGDTGSGDTGSGDAGSSGTGTGGNSGNSGGAAAEGTVVTDSTGTVSYTVTSSAGEEPTVEYKKNSAKKKSVTVLDTVTIDGVTYKVTTIAASAFKNNKTVTKIVIGKNIVGVGKNAFSGCKKLKTINIKSKKLASKNVKKNAFKGISTKTVIKVPKTKKKEYTKLLRKKGLSKKVKIK